MEECKAYCCRKGYLTLTEKEARVVSPEKKLPQDEQGKFMVNLFEGCPALDGVKCSIHNSPDYPKTCREFPLFIDENTVILSLRCPAVRENKFYPYEAEFIKKGFKVIHRMKFLEGDFKP